MRALTERKLRAVLTILGIVIGPATIVALVGATQGYSNATASRFETLGATTVLVSPVGRGFSLTTDAVQEMQSLSGVSSVVPYQEASGTLAQGGETVSVSIVAMDLTKLSIIFPSLSLQSGSAPSNTDPVGALVGNSVAYPDIQNAENVSVNQVITASNVRTSAFAFFGPGGGGAVSGATRSFVVRGVLTSFGESFFINPDDSIFTGPAAGQQLLGSATYTGVIVIASSAGTVTQVINELTTQFGNSIRTTAVTSLLSTVQSVTQGATTLLEAVAGTSVIVAFVGIMTTMLTSVLERTTEIGVLKSLGTTSRSILLAFITEAAVTGLIGGVAGAAVGTGLSFVLIGYLSGSGLGSLGFGSGAARVASGSGGASFRGATAATTASTTLSITPAITPELIAIGILIALAVGTIGGILPAWRASRLTPVEALHRA